VLRGCRLEPSLTELPPVAPVQFERLGYFILDSRAGGRERMVFNRSVTLRDSWAKVKDQ
jgi:glutaminyl-tRNA synthetase